MTTSTTSTASTTSTWDLNDPSLLQRLYPDQLTFAGLLSGFGVQFAPIPVLGDVGVPGVYNLPNLAPATTEPASYTAAGTPVSDTYTGVTLWNLLQRAGGVTTTDAKNDILGKYVIVTGSDCYQAVFSPGEIDPEFGNQPVLVADSDTAANSGHPAPTGWPAWWCRAMPLAAVTSPIS